jgi:hypothetical protein
MEVKIKLSKSQRWVVELADVVAAGAEVGIEGVAVGGRPRSVITTGRF